MRIRSCVFFLVAAACAVAAPINVALNKPVTLAGSFGGGTASTLTDGVFRPDQTQWQDGTVWWIGTAPTVTIDLQGLYTLTGGIVQADNNDSYLMQYQDASNGWHNLWTVPVSCCSGMATRPSRSNNAQIFDFVAPVSAKAIRMSAVSGDSYYSLSEVQVFASPSSSTPEPATFGIAAAGLALAGLLRRCRA